MFCGLCIAVWVVGAQLFSRGTLLFEVDNDVKCVCMVLEMLSSTAGQQSNAGSRGEAKERGKAI